MPWNSFSCLQVPDSPAKRSGGGKRGSREAGVAWRDALLTAALLRGWGVTVVRGCLVENPQNCSSNVFNAQSWRSARVWKPSMRPRSNSSCLPMLNPWEETALRSWSETAGSIMASSFYHGSEKDPDADSSNNGCLLYKQGAGKGQVKGRQGSVVQGRVRKVQSSRQAQGWGQAEVSNPRQWQKVQNSRQAQGQGRQNDQNRDN
ncbi:uncharacterized protein LOC115208403 [Salmo trutta]|uniref:uncharacterized protein LOC115208403 n=1 Tax=Salmo trutta TaxID=8032 RepID=UPI0011314C06|nr:uncharacterized protein LOC115208403 [Salmo trutta]